MLWHTFGVLASHDRPLAAILTMQQFCRLLGPFVHDDLSVNAARLGIAPVLVKNEWTCQLAIAGGHAVTSGAVNHGKIHAAKAVAHNTNRFSKDGIQRPMLPRCS